MSSLTLPKISDWLGIGASPFPGTIERATTAARSALTQAFQTASFEGVEDIRFLPRNREVGRLEHRIYVILGTHDVRRDRRIIELICQFDDVECELVPARAAARIPNAAQSLLR